MIKVTAAVAAELEARQVRKLAKMTPKCPACKQPLIHRPSDRRFIEDDYYVQCATGHSWRLTNPEPATDS